MFSRQLLSSLAIISICYSPIAHSLELVDTTENLDKQPTFINIQNATLSPVSITFSNGESIKLQEDTGKSTLCNDIQGLVMFVNSQYGTSELSSNMLCGHSYTVKESAQ
jgi:hypothetical protein